MFLYHELRAARVVTGDQADGLINIPGTSRCVVGSAYEYTLERREAGGQWTGGDRSGAATRPFDLRQRDGPRVRVAGDEAGVDLVARGGDIGVIDR